MRIPLVIMCLGVVALLAACSSAQSRAARAQKAAFEAEERVGTERLNLVDKYQRCVSAAGGNAQRIEACDSYLRAAEALK